MNLPLRLAERGWIPDAIVRMGIRHLLRKRLHEEIPSNPRDVEEKVRDFARTLAQSPIAMETRAANEQHYELPPEFFQFVLGPCLKYSSCFWKEGIHSLAEAEIEMLRLTAERAEIHDGQTILDLGCGWGSFSLWAADRYPSSKITAVSNSAPQRNYILTQVEQREIHNLEVLTRDMNDFHPATRFDRIVSVEMLEHLRNYESFFERVRGWLENDGKFFVHIFCHRSMPYAFEPVSDDDWMARFFFSGGIMPSGNLFRRFDKDLHVTREWRINGIHYSKTLEAWLANQDRCHREIRSLFSQCYGPENCDLWFQRWRIFFMACSELFRFKGGEEWLIGHFLLEPR